MIYVFGWRSKKDLCSVCGIYFLPPDAHVCVALLTCLFCGSHCWVFPSLFEVTYYFNQNSDETMRITAFLMKYYTVFNDHLLCVCAKNKISGLHHKLHYIHFHCWTRLSILSIVHMVQAHVYTTKYELYTAPASYCKCHLIDFQG